MSVPPSNRPQRSLLEAARARGQAYKEQELASAENLTAEDVSAMLGMPVEWLHSMRQSGNLYALGSSRETLVFPRWQLRVDQERLSHVLQALRVAGLGDWGIHAFLTSPLQQIEGSPRDWIADTSLPLAPLLQLIRRQFADDQGAG